MKSLFKQCLSLRGPFAIVATMMLLLALGTPPAHGASAVLGGIDIAGSDKGLVLTLSADAPFAVSPGQKPASAKTGTAAPQQVSVRCSKAIYGLEEFSFSDFPKPSPVRRIAVTESPAEGVIDLLIDVNVMPEKQMLLKQKGTKWIILLSRQPSPGFSWSAAPSAGAVASSPAQPKVQAPDNGQSNLTDITLLTRDKVERISFLFDRPTVMRLKREQDRVVVLFVNASSSLASQRFTPPSAQISSIELKQIAHGGTMWLGASLYLRKESGASAIMQAFSDRLVIYCATDSVERFALWSAGKGAAMSYPFVEMPRLQVDYRGMEQKAKTDLAATVNTASTFTVREEPAKAPATDAVPTREVQATPQPPAAATLPTPAEKEPVAVKLLVVKNNVNLRNGPSSKDSIVSRLPIGSSAQPLAKKDGWIRIKTAEATGWVMQSMVVDSSRAPKDVLDKIEHARRQRLDQLAAEERAAELMVQKKKAIEDQKARKQKQLDELAAKKLAEKEAKEKLAQQKKEQDEAQKQLAAKVAAARDSVLRYNAAKQDSIERAKQSGPKLVEYHVLGRDPFLPLSRDQESPVPAVEDLNLVGILYDQVDRIGLLEDKQDKTRAYALRENDPVQNGYVLRVQPDKVLFLINEMGISRTYVLKLMKEKR